MSARRLDRREFIEGSAAAGVALVVGLRLAPEASAQEPAARPAPSPFDAWIRVAGDGAVTLIVAKSEMGQGVFTTMPMLLAEELRVDFANVGIEQAATDAALYPNLGTGGSTSVRTSYEPLRRAAAVARTMLVGAAAERGGVGATECRAEAGASWWRRRRSDRCPIPRRWR
jgi:isoquinoline 1-oxidoreductase beta subunit